MAQQYVNQPYPNQPPPYQPQKPPAFQAFFRLVIMVGVTAVSGMALYQYGPPPEQAMQWADQALRVGTQKWNEWNTQQTESAPSATPYGSNGANSLATDSSQLAPSQFAAPDGLKPLAGDFRFDASVEPASGIDPLSPGNPASLEEPQLLPALAMGGTPMPATLSVDPVLAPLAQQLIDLGAQDLELKRWGSEGQMHRFSCGASMGATGFQRRFDAIETSPQAAVQRVLAEVWQWKQSRVTHRQKISQR